MHWNWGPGSFLRQVVGSGVMSQKILPFLAYETAKMPNFKLM